MSANSLMNTIDCSSKVFVRAYIMPFGEAKMTLRTGFATALQAARKAKDLTQEDFSDVSSRTYLSSLERGLKVPTIEKVAQLATVLGLHPLTLMTMASMEDENVPLEKILERVRREIRQVDPKN